MPISSQVKLTWFFLSPENKQLLAKLKKRYQDTVYVLLWRREGKFFVRKAAGDQVQEGITLDDIDNLK